MGQAGFRQDYQTTNRILVLKAIIEEACSRSSKVFCCFVDLQKAFDTVPRHLLVERLQSVGISRDLFVAISRLYETMIRRFYSSQKFSDSILAP